MRDITIRIRYSERDVEFDGERVREHRLIVTDSQTSRIRSIVTATRLAAAVAVGKLAFRWMNLA